MVEIIYKEERQIRVYQCRTIVPIVQEQLGQLFYNQRVKFQLPLA